MRDDLNEAELNAIGDDRLLAAVMRRIVVNSVQVSRLCNYEETVNFVSFTAEPVPVSVEEWDALNALPGMGYEADPQPEPDVEEGSTGG